MQKDYKNIIYEKYYSVHTKNLYGNVTLESIRQQFKFWKYYFSEFLPKDKKLKILDAGCGNGGFTMWLTELGYFNTVGIDVSKEMIDISKSLDIKNTFQDNIFQHLRSNKNKYNIIFCRDVLEHFDKTEILELFYLFFESLTPEGKVIIQVPNGYSHNYGKIYYSDFTHETLFSESVLNQLTQTIGFKSLYVKEINPVPHGFISVIRFILWKLLKIKYQIYQLIENGYAHGFFSQNIIAEIKK